MSSQVTAGHVGEHLTCARASDVVLAFERRLAPAQALAEHASDLVAAARAMAGRFAAGGKLIAFGTGAASADAQHVAVEFVHPVLVGKRALPAISLNCDVASITAIAAGAGLGQVLAHQLARLAEPADIALGFAAGPDCAGVLAGLRTARAAGLLTVALTDVSLAGGEAGPADHLLAARSADPRVVKEIHVTIYHLLWELVHVFVEQPACITCSDSAVPGMVVALLDDDLAIIETSAGQEEVSVALVATRVGDTVLVHAGEAIAVM
jgi:phosphoheptose isomerase